MQKNLKISILGKNYCISTDENEDDIIKAADLVNALMKSKTDKGAAPGDEKAAIAVALQLATDLTKKQKLLLVHENKTSQLISLLDKEL